MATTADLNEAKAALHKLRIGKSVVSVKKDGREIQYGPADEAKLAGYVSQLELAVSPDKPRRRPARFF